MTEPQTLGEALTKTAQPKDTKTVLDVIAGMAPELEKSLQSEAAAETLTRHYFTAIRYNELLRQCTAESLVAALLLSAQVRLEPGPLGHVYLVPFKRQGVFEVTWILGYTGIVQLAMRGGAKAVRAHVIWDCDDYRPPFDTRKGLDWRYAPGADDDRTERVGVLVAWKDAGEPMALHVPLSRIERAQQASAAFKATSGPWFTDTDAMWRKTGVRAARPFLPLSVDLATAATYDGHTARSLDVVDGEAVPVLDAGEGEES